VRRATVAWRARPPSSPRSSGRGRATCATSWPRSRPSRTRSSAPH
jgi:hypothetical protein